MNLKNRLRDIQTDCRDRLYDLAPPNRGGLKQHPHLWAFTCRWRNRPQHKMQKSLTFYTSSLAIMSAPILKALFINSLPSPLMPECSVSLPLCVAGEQRNRTKTCDRPRLNHCLGEAFQNYSELERALCVLCSPIQVAPYSGQRSNRLFRGALIAACPNVIRRESSMPVNHSAPKPLQVAAVVIGNALEWYDFTIFGVLTVIISRLFFPAENQYASLLLTTATFGVGFFTRPIGGILLGIYADHKGRKAALLLIIFLMTAAIAMIGFAPTYAAIGVAAPFIVVLARLLQGFATGGEFASATSFLIETAPAHRRGLYGSWQMVGQGLAVFVGALLGALLTRNLAPEALDSWGWRVPFLLGLVIGPVGLFIRRHLQETEAFLEARGAMTVRQGFGTRIATNLTTLATSLKEVLVCMGLTISGTISFYVILLYMPTFAHTQLHLPLDQAFVAQLISLVCMIVLIPLSGALSDRIGRKPIIIAALTLYLALVYPLFHWVHDNPSFGSLVIVQIVLCCLLGVFFGPISTAGAEQFAARARSSGLGIAYNLAVMIFGGFAQFFVTWLVKATGSPIAPSFYMMFGAVIGVVAALFLVDRALDVHLPTLVTVRPRSRTAELAT